MNSTNDRPYFIHKPDQCFELTQQDMEEVCQLLGEPLENIRNCKTKSQLKHHCMKLAATNAVLEKKLKYLVRHTLMGHSGDADEMVGQWLPYPRFKPDDCSVSLLCICLLDGKHPVIGSYADNYDAFVYMGGTKSGKVTHYMPLPLPPETGE